MKPRLYQSEEIPTDDENWLMCYRCGKVTPIHDVRYDNDKLVPYSEPSDNPFDFGPAMLSSKPRDLEEEANRKFEEDFSEVQDINLRNELRKGNILLSYSESDNADTEIV